MNNIPRSLRSAGLFLVTVASFALGRAQAPLAVAGSASGGNPFSAPAAKVYSIYDYQGIDNVTDALREFIELNDSLTGTVTPAPLTGDTARRNLRGLLGGDDNRAFLKVLNEAPKLQTVGALNAAAMLFYSRGRSAEALACLLRAVDRAPQDPAALLNLAGAALVYRQANEALALLASAEKLGALPAGAWGMSGARLADYLRGYAFMLRGEYSAARPLLVRVVAAEPNLKEAALALALVEAKLGENPRRAFLQGVWRHRGKLVVRDREKPADEAEADHEPDPFTAGEQISPSMPAYLDVSKATPGKLPPVARPATPVEFIGMLFGYTEAMVKSMDTALRQHQAAEPAYQSFDASPAKPAYKRRMISLYNRALLRIGATAELDQAAYRTDFLREKLDRLTESETTEAMAAQEPMHKRFSVMNNRPNHPTKAEARAQINELNSTTQRALERTSRLLASYHQALDDEYNLRSSYMYGMLGHIGAPGLRTALLAEAESVRAEMQVAQLSAVLNHQHTIGSMDEAKAFAPEDGTNGKGLECSDEDAKWSVGVDLHVVGAELNCNSVSLELEMPVIPPFVGVSAEVGIDTSGTVTVFVGPKVSASNVGSAKDGLYITAGKDGVRDFGGKAEVKTSQGIGPITVNQKIGEGSVSFLPGPDTGEPSGPMPVFAGGND